MATRKQARKQTLVQVLTLLIAVVVIVVAVVLFQSWSNNRPGAHPKDIRVTATVGDESIEVAPYLVCEPGTECPEGEVPNLYVGENDTLKLDIPDDISRYQWQVLSIYDDPAANDETRHGAGETEAVEIPGSVDPIEASDSQDRPKLIVVEVSAVLIGADDNGDEAPYSSVWSLSTMSDEELAEQENM
ncbi:DUF2771 domain-containing protein [Corynebacterium stationis]|uniref:DUF2771 domain-containing protein n=1 Tax=Corynebacterium stationis TaxID=1705 RepID=UPI0028AD9346|nr:DUF2771 domain-containing protein [Corynebacterium stationis]